MSPLKNKIYYIDRRTNKVEEEKIYFESALRFLYSSRFGKVLAILIANCLFFSRLSGWWQRLPFSKKKIAPFVKKYGISISEFAKPLDQYSSFDDFFTRKLKTAARSISKKALVPADGRYLFYQDISQCDGFIVKGVKFSLENLLNSAELAKRYAHSSMAIARLAPCDYHRFHFPVDCVPGAATLINGPLYSVNPIAIKQKIDLLIENKRMLTALTTKQYGTILFIEIGATSVGSIHQTYIPHHAYKKGDEKGFFSFGGSSIILLFEPGTIQFAYDLIGNSTHHIETLCLFGQSLEDEI